VPPDRTPGQDDDAGVPGRQQPGRDDVARVCRALPGTSEAVSASGRRRWSVRGRTFLREWPLHRRYLDELGAAAPAGPVLVAYVPDGGAKAALLSAEPGVFFTTSHFDGWPAVLCRLDALDEEFLVELATEAWASRAPSRLVAETLAPG
jgi:hypothetical protein